MVKLIAEGVGFEIDENIHSITTFFKDLSDIEGKNSDVELTTFKKADVERLFEACKIVAYKFNNVVKVDQADPVPYIGGPLSQFFSTLSFDQLNVLFKLAKHLRVNGLQNNISAYISAKLHMKLSIQQYKKKRESLHVKHELTTERSKALKQRFAWLN